MGASIPPLGGSPPGKGRAAQTRRFRIDKRLLLLLLLLLPLDRVLVWSRCGPAYAAGSPSTRRRDRGRAGVP